MIANIENPKLLNILEGPSALQGSFACRPSHALVCKRSGETVYHFPEKTLSLCQGEVLFIPQGTAYRFSKVSPGESRYVILNFQGVLPHAQPEKYRLEALVDFDHLCARLCRHRVTDTLADRHRATALLYELLALLSETEKTAYTQARTLALLEPAAAYLKENLFDPALRIGSLHTLCGISDTYFRRLFLARFGTCPKKYVLSRRLRHAKAILEHGEYNSIAEAARLSGFDDPLYFSKVFKSAYGAPPSRHR